MTTFSLVQVINRTGWLVTECYQRDHDQWFAALRQRGDYTAAHGEGETMDQALEAAWLVAQKHRHTTSAEWEQLRNPSTSKPKIERPRKIARPRRA